MAVKEKSMADILEKSKIQAPPINLNDKVEGVIIDMSRSEILVDIPGYKTAILYRSRYNSFDTLKDMKIGGKIQATVVELENEEGYVVLSLKQFIGENAWDFLKRKKELKETLTIRPIDANKGGLLIDFEGVKGFLPVSQLAPEHYPKVLNSDKQEILTKLHQLVGKSLEVIVLDINRRENKLIFSEKEVPGTQVKEKTSRYKIGEKVKGKVTGIADFGIFLDVDGTESLIHVSEIAWDKIEDSQSFIKVGDVIEAEIIDFEKDKLSLSLKNLAPDPWEKFAKIFKRGNEVKGRVTKMTPFGSFVEVDFGIEGLVRIEKGSKIKDIIEEGKEYSFKILELDIVKRKLSLELSSK